MRKIIDTIKFIVAYIFAFFVRKYSKKPIWIITERKAECKDNGYYLFKYVRENCFEETVYYAISSDSKHVDKIKQYGNILEFNSFKHYVYALAADKLIGAFLPCGIPDSIAFYKFYKFIKGDIVFLQHGITKELIDSLKYSNTKAKLFVCGAKPEYDFVKKEFGYQDNAVKYTGFCRFDGLIDFDKDKTILVMPTWRQWIPSATWDNGNAQNLEQYDYFVKLKELIENDEIRELLQKYHYKLIFFLHHEMQPYIDYFGESDDVVIIASEKDYDVQYLLRTSACLITDYSSVAFDFSYMKKPMLYYQFDEEKYYSEHYKKGYFDYETMGFGPKCSNIKDVVFEINNLFNKNMIMDSKYEKRVDSFFVYRDDNNCKRVYCEIKNIKG